VRKTVTLIAGAFVVIVGIAILMIVYLGYCARQVKAERDKVHMGTTVDQVLPLVQGALAIWMHALVPDTVFEEEGAHYESLLAKSDGTFGCLCAPNHQWRQLSQSQAVPLMNRTMSDGHEWRWRYTFIKLHPAVLLLYRDLRARRRSRMSPTFGAGIRRSAWRSRNVKGRLSE
jgi:hypothetical protein